MFFKVTQNLNQPFKLKFIKNNEIKIKSFMDNPI